MSVSRRPAKVFRLNYWLKDPDIDLASLAIYGNPAEIKMSVNPRTFISVNGSGLSLSPGLGKQINIQGLPQNMRYGGLLADLPFPLSVIPVTPFTTFPNQIFVPPLLAIMPAVTQIAALTSLIPNPAA